MVVIQCINVAGTGGAIPGNIAVAIWETVVAMGPVLLVASVCARQECNPPNCSSVHEAQCSLEEDRQPKGRSFWDKVATGKLGLDSLEISSNEEWKDEKIIRGLMA